MKAIKDYWAFTSLLYRLIMILVVPGVMIVLGGLCIKEEIPVLAVFLVCYLLLLYVDAASDYWLLGGFYRKSNSALEYLQTSNRFKGMIRDVVIVDMVRRVLTYSGIYLIIYLMGMNQEMQKEWFGICSYIPLYCFVFGQAAVFISRHFNTWQHVFVVCSFTIFVASMGLIRMNSLFIQGGYELLVNGILMMLAIAAAVVTIVYSLKKVRDSYYDK